MAQQIPDCIYVAALYWVQLMNDGWVGSGCMSHGIAAADTINATGAWWVENRHPTAMIIAAVIAVP